MAARKRPRQRSGRDLGGRSGAGDQTVRSRVVVEVDGAEEAVLGGLGEQEVGEGPLDDGYEHGDEEEAGDEGDLPGLPVRGCVARGDRARARER